MEGQRLATFGEAADVGCVVEGFDMPARTGNGHAVQQLEEIEVQSIENRRGRALLRWKVGPGIECRLGTTKDTFDVLFSAQLVGQVIAVAFVGQGQLVLQVAEAVVDRGGGKHQHLGLYPLADHLIHQALVAGFFVLEGVIVAEVMRLVDHDQVIVAPVDAIQLDAQRGAACPA